MSSVAFVTLWLRAGIGHPVHGAIAIFGFAAIYIGLGAIVGAAIRGPLEGSLLVMLVFAVDAFSGPQMSGGGLAELTPTRHGANLLIAAGGGHGSPAGDWTNVALVALGSLPERRAHSRYRASHRTARRRVGRNDDEGPARPGDGQVQRRARFCAGGDDLSLIQTPMFHSRPAHLAFLLPGYGPTRLMLDGDYFAHFQAGGALIVSLAWLAGLATVAVAIFERQVGRKSFSHTPRGYKLQGA